MFYPRSVDGSILGLAKIAAVIRCMSYTSDERTLRQLEASGARARRTTVVSSNLHASSLSMMRLHGFRVYRV